MSQLHAPHAALVLLALVAPWGCTVQSDNGTISDESSCTEGLKWTGGNQEDARMHPGRDCIACHASEGEGPTYAIAGTVAPLAGEADDCFGVAGVTVEITDANGGLHEEVTNDAGNFSFRGTLALPYTARLLFEGRERVMATPQSVGACNSCHTSTGANAAPGRILVP